MSLPIPAELEETGHQRLKCGDSDYRYLKGPNVQIGRFHGVLLGAALGTY